MHGDAPGERVQTFGEGEEEPVRGGGGGQSAQLGKVGEGGGDVAGADVRKRLRHPVGLGGGDAQGERRVPQGVPGPVGLGHRGEGDPFPAETLDDPVVRLQSAGGLHIEVDIGEVGALT